MNDLGKPELRPRKRWFVAAVAVAFIGLASGVGVLVAGIVGYVNPMPRIEQRFRADETVSVHLDAGQEKFIWTSDSDDKTWRCTSEDGASFTPIATTYYYDKWHSMLRIAAVAPGEYTVRCTASLPSSDRLAITGAIDGKSFAKRIAGWLGLVFGLPCLGVILGGATALAVMLRRRSYRARLAGVSGHQPGVSA